jgi:hypothetical protein
MAGALQRHRSDQLAQRATVEPAHIGAVGYCFGGAVMNTRECRHSRHGRVRFVVAPASLSNRHTRFIPDTLHSSAALTCPGQHHGRGRGIALSRRNRISPPLLVSYRRSPASL